MPPSRGRPTDRQPKANAAKKSKSQESEPKRSALPASQPQKICQSSSAGRSVHTLSKIVGLTRSAIPSFLTWAATVLTLVSGVIVFFPRVTVILLALTTPRIHHRSLSRLRIPMLFPCGMYTSDSGFVISGRRRTVLGPNIVMGQLFKALFTIRSGFCTGLTLTKKVRSLSRICLGATDLKSKWRTQTLLL